MQKKCKFILKATTEETMFINVQLQLFRQANFHWMKGTIHLKNQIYIFSLSPVVLFIHLLFWCELPSFKDNSRRDDDGMMGLDCTQQRRKSRQQCVFAEIMTRLLMMIPSTELVSSQWTTCRLFCRKI